MATINKIDTVESLAQLTGIDWGPAPAGVGALIQERHEIRRMPICQSPDEAIIRSLEIEGDLDILLPVALLLHDSEGRRVVMCRIERRTV